MATINYLPSFPISDRVFPCPRKHMLIYGQKSPSPPPATLTQEQLARDAGQLVEAHALLDRLCDDTDRSQHSLVHRIKQILLGSEEMNKVLEKAGFNTAAGLLDCVRAMSNERTHFKDHLGEADKRNLGYQLEITRLKDRNKRLHDAQGSGNSAVAELINIRKRLLSSFPGKTVEEAAIALGGIATEGVVEQLVEALKRQQPNAELERVREILSKLTHRSDRGVAGMAQDAVTMNLNQRGMIEQLRAEAGKDPALDKMVQEAHRLLHRAEVSPLSGTIVERVRSLVEERDRLQRLVSAGDLFLHKAVNDAHLLLDKAGIPGGRIDERVRVAIERGQVAKPKPWSVSQCSVMHADGNRRIHCTSRELAEQTCEMLNRQEAR